MKKIYHKFVYSEQLKLFNCIKSEILILNQIQFSASLENSALVEKELFIESVNKICSVVSTKNRNFWKKLISKFKKSKNKTKSNRFKKLKIWVLGIFIAVNFFIKILFGVGVENSNQQFISDSYQRNENISIVHYHPYAGLLWDDSYKPLKTLTSVYDNPNKGNIFERNFFLFQHVTNQLRSGADQNEYIPQRVLEIKVQMHLISMNFKNVVEKALINY